MASAMRVLCKIAELAEISEAPFWQCCGKAAPLYPVFLCGVKRPALPWGRGGDASPIKWREPLQNTKTEGQVVRRFYVFLKNLRDKASARVHFLVS